MTATTPEAAQASLDRFCVATGDARTRRAADGTPTTVGALADAEPLRALPAVGYPATVEVTRVVAANATVAFRGNRYSIPPGLAGVEVTVRHRLGAATVDIVATRQQRAVHHQRHPTRSHPDAQAFLARKTTEGKTRREARRAHKRPPRQPRHPPHVARPNNTRRRCVPLAPAA